MFGYIKPLVPELRIKEYDFYKSVYCGLCRCMGRKGNCCACASLSYDFVFLALVRMVFSDETPKLESCRCVVHPFKKRAYVLPCGALEYSAEASTILTRSKLLDDISDSKGIKRLRARLTLPFFPDRENYPALSEAARAMTDELGDAERSQAPSVDLPAEAFARLMSKLFSYGLKDTEKRIADEFGFHIGKWIYAADAADDYEKDKKSGNFNPFVILYPEKIDKDAVKRAMTLELCGAEKALALFPFSDYGVESIIKNIMYCGMPQIADKIFAKAETGRKA